MRFEYENTGINNENIVSDIRKLCSSILKQEDKMWNQMFDSDVPGYEFIHANLNLMVELFSIQYIVENKIKAMMDMREQIQFTELARIAKENLNLEMEKLTNE